MVSLIPFSKQCLLLGAVKKAPIASLNAIVINSLSTKELKHSQMSPFLVFTLKTDRFQNAPFSTLCVFVSVFEKRSSVNARPKRKSFAPFHMKTEQCERGLKNTIHGPWGG